MPTLLSGFDHNITQWQHGASRFHSSTGGRAGAFLTATTGGRMTLGNNMSVVSVR